MTMLWNVMFRVSTLLALAAVGCLIGLSLLTGVDVIGRYVFGRPLPGFTNAIPLVMALVIAAFFPALTLQERNVVVRPFARASAVSRFLDSFAALITTIFFAVMAWQFINYAAEALSSREYVPVLRWPVGPWWGGVAAIVAITAVAALLVLLRSIAGRATKE